MNYSDQPRHLMKNGAIPMSGLLDVSESAPPPEQLTLGDLLQGFQGGGESYPDPFQLAANDGISFQTKRALMELDKDGAGPQVAPSGPGVGSLGKESQITQGWKDRNQQRQHDEGVRLFMQRGMSREQAERAVGGGR